MALTLATPMRNALADAIDTQIGTTATLEFQTSGDVEVATLPLSNPAFGSASTGVISVTGTPQDTSATGGTMAKFVIKSGGTTVQITGTVGTSGADINFAGGVTIGAGDTVTLSSLTITVPAS